MPFSVPHTRSPNAVPGFVKQPPGLNLFTFVQEDFELLTMAQIFDVQQGTTASIDSTHAFTGSNALHIHQTGSASASTKTLPSGMFSGGQTLVGRYHLWIASNPSASLGISQTQTGVTGNQLVTTAGLMQGGWTASLITSAVTVTDSNWHTIDFKIDTRGTTWTYDWMVDGVAQTQSTKAASGTSVNAQYRFGYVGAVTIDYWVDMWQLSDNLEHYPLSDPPVVVPVTQTLAVNFSQATVLAPINQIQKQPFALTEATTLAVTKQPQKPIALTEMVSLQNQAVSVDAAIHGSGLTFTHTTSGTDRYLVVGVTGATQDTSTGVTYAGAAMTLLNRSVGVANTLTTEIWGLVNPALSANSVIITRSGTNGTPDQGAISFNNVNQSDPVGQSGGNNGGAVTPSLTLKSPVVVAPPGGMLVDMAACENPITNNLGTAKWTASPAFGGDGQAILAATGDSQPQFTTWTQGSNQVWTMSIVVLKPSMAPVNQVRKTIAITEAATLSLVKNITKTAFALTQATTLTVLKTLVKLITVTLTQATTLTVTKRISKPITLSQASAATIANRVSKGIALTQTTTLAVAKAVSKPIALVQATTLALTKRVSKTLPLTQATSLSAVVGSLKRLTVAVSQASTLAVAKTAQKSIALSEATTLAVKKTANKSVGLSQATALALTKKASKIVAIPQATSLTATNLVKKTIALTQATVLVASAVKGATLKTLSVALTQASALTVKKTVAKPIALTEAATLALMKRCSSTFALAQASTLGITKLVSHRISVTQATAISAAFSITRRLSVAVSQATGLVIHKTTAKSVSVAQNTSVAARKTVSKTVVLAQATAVSTTKSVARRIALAAGTAFSATVSFVSKLRGGSAVSSDSAVWLSTASDSLMNAALPTDALASKAVTSEAASGVTTSDSPVGNAGISDSL